MDEEVALADPLSYADDVPYENQLDFETTTAKSDGLKERIGNRIYLIEDALTKKVLSYSISVNLFLTFCAVCRENDWTSSKKTLKSLTSQLLRKTWQVGFMHCPFTGLGSDSIIFVYSFRSIEASKCPSFTRISYFADVNPQSVRLCHTFQRTPHW